MQLKTHDIICLIETWSTNEVTLNAWSNDYNLIWINAVKENKQGRPSGGLVILVNKRLTKTVLHISNNNCFISIKDRDNDFIVGLTYLRPNDEQFNKDLEDFSEAIENITNQFPSTPIYLMGDYNARIGNPIQLPEEIFTETNISENGVFSDCTINKRGKAVIDTMSNNNFIVINGKTVSDSPAKPTYVGNGSSIIDLAWSNTLGIEKIIDFEVRSLLD